VKLSREKKEILSLIEEYLRDEDKFGNDEVMNLAGDRFSRESIACIIGELIRRGYLEVVRQSDRGQKRLVRYSGGAKPRESLGFALDPTATVSREPSRPTHGR
jgi:hypothetical protein